MAALAWQRMATVTHDSRPRRVSGPRKSRLKGSTTSGGSEVPRNRIDDKITVSDAISRNLLRGMICSTRLGIGVNCPGAIDARGGPTRVGRGGLGGPHDMGPGCGRWCGSAV